VLARGSGICCPWISGKNILNINTKSGNYFFKNEFINILTPPPPNLAPLSLGKKSQ
jgi:hypothetical protein